MEAKNEHFRHILLFYFRKGKKAAKAYRDICEIYGDDVLSERTCQNWFTKFRCGDFSIKDSQRPGRPSEVDDDRIKAVIEADRYITVREIADKFGVSHTAIENHLKRLKLVKKLDIWVPSEPNEAHSTQRLSVCDMHLKRFVNDPFLNQIVTGDLKWFVYNYTDFKLSGVNYPVPNTSKEMSQRKVLVSIWWDHSGILYFELVKEVVSITSDIYCEQLEKLDKAIKEKRPELAKEGVIFLHDDSKPHTNLAVRQKILEFDWEVLAHPPQSPDLAPSDYHLFKSLENSLREECFINDDDFKLELVQFFEKKEQQFYENGIVRLPERWQKVLKRKGKYIIE